MVGRSPKPSAGMLSTAGFPGPPEIQYMWFHTLPPAADEKKRSNST